MSVVEKAKKLAVIDSNAETQLNNVLEVAAIKMENVLGEDNYAAYQLLEDGNADKEKLEYAEAYYALYYLAISLKKLQKTAVTPTQIGFDKGQIIPSVIDEINKMREIYKSEADAIIEQYLDSGSGNAKMRMYAI